MYDRQPDNSVPAAWQKGSWLPCSVGVVLPPLCLLLTWTAHAQSTSSRQMISLVLATRLSLHGIRACGATSQSFDLCSSHLDQCPSPGIHIAKPINCLRTVARWVVVATNCGGPVVRVECSVNLDRRAREEHGRSVDDVDEEASSPPSKWRRVSTPYVLVEGCIVNSRKLKQDRFRISRVRRANLRDDVVEVLFLNVVAGVDSLVTKFVARCL
ncbi:hypothetical protein LZ30DRAFT_65914 [Colletotrichum cereale]|nr:hypothetical protein LZ30DRAFT_65914 [Colletotrichum cereale]